MEGGATLQRLPTADRTSKVACFFGGIPKTPWTPLHGVGGTNTLLGMVRGPAPTPKHILQLRGSKEAAYREELGTKVNSLPEPADWMRENAKEMFRQVAGFCQGMGTLAESDQQVIARYAIVWDKWQEAERELAKPGAEAWKEVLAPDGSLRFSRPSKWQAQSNHCHEQLRQLETVLGLTPADRTRLGYGAVKVTTDPVDAMFDDVATG